MSRTLCVVSPGRLAAGEDGRVQVDPKTAAGMVRYAAGWPGRVHFVARRGPVDERSQPFDWPLASDLPFDVTISDDVGADLRRISPRVSLVPLESENDVLLDLPGRIVLVSDYPLRVRWDNARLDPRSGHADLARTALGLARRARTVRAMIRRADGLQCNGYDTFDTYARHSRDPLLYLDTRVGTADIVAASGVATTSSGRATDPLRLSFSGRWIEQKGVLDVVDIAAGLHDDGVPVHLTLLGGGPLEQELRRRDHPAVAVRGRLDFAREWVPFVRDEVDVMVLPHPQGDSASTFLESMSCGAPVAGYDNRYWRSLHARSGGGWVSPTGDRRALADTIATLAEDRSQVSSQRAAGLGFAAEHSFDKEFARRLDHLGRIAGW